jgi:uncharacterized protein (TIGR02145 family)
MIVYNGNIVVNNGRWIIPERMKYKVNLIQTEGGTISAVPVTGINGVTVTLSNTPNQYYSFDGYTVNGATLYGGNKFDFDNSDVTVSASFKWNYVDPVVGETVKIGDQIWMKNTLAVDTTSGGLKKLNVTANGYNFGTIYFYQYRTLKPIVANIDGWHIPTEEEYRTLWDIVCPNGTNREIAKKLRGNKGWNSHTICEDTVGFSAYPFGYLWWNGGDTSGEWVNTQMGKDCHYHGYEVDSYTNADLEIMGATLIDGKWSPGQVQVGYLNWSSQQVSAWKQNYLPARLIKDY